MKTLLCLLAIWFISFLAGNAYGDFTGKGHVHELSETKQTFLNPDCRSTGTCDLKRFTLTTLVQEVWFSDDPANPTYGNGVIMEYETDSVAAIEKYAIVQFVRGCVYRSSTSSGGKLNRTVSYIVPSFGKDVPLCFSEWVIDSQDNDPVYNSDPEYGRFYLLRWNQPGSYDSRTQRYYGVQKPKLPVVYMTDYPAGAFFVSGGIKNAALEFNTCIYRARDVPTETRRNDINFAKPITCFKWQNVYVYDYGKGKFQSEWPDLRQPHELYTLVPVYLPELFVTIFSALVLASFLRLRQLTQRNDRY